MKTTFAATVTADGGEVADCDPTGSPVTFTLQCDGVPIYTLTGTRFTTALGTQIVSLTPTSSYPQFTLPRGALSTGTHQDPSTMEILEGLTPYKLYGRCTISTV